MRILICPSAYKGSFGAQAVANAIASGIADLAPHHQLRLLPFADGGDDTLACLQAYRLASSPLIQTFLDLPDAFSRMHKTCYLRESDFSRAFIELACICGLAVSCDAAEEGYPGTKSGCRSTMALQAHTAGLGQAIAHAIASGIKNIVVFIGGSASTDGGSGMLSALGLEFLDAQDRAIVPCGGHLMDIRAVSPDSVQYFFELFKGVELLIACDVNNPLYGPDGAAAVFGPQKGASLADVKYLDQALRHFCDILAPYFSQVPHLANLPGAGAAGGTAFGLGLVPGARMLSGFDLIADLVDINSEIDAADAVIIGEGMLDKQSMQGKACGRIIDIAFAKGKPVYALPALARQAQSLLDAQYLKGLITTAGADGRADLISIRAAANQLTSRFFLENRHDVTC